MNYYDILGVPRDASPEEIVRAYKALAKLKHPDVHPSPERKEWATQQMRLLNEARETLSDPDKRREYDRGKKADASPSDTKTEPPIPVIHFEKPLSKNLAVGVVRELLLVVENVGGPANTIDVRYTPEGSWIKKITMSGDAKRILIHITVDSYGLEADESYQGNIRIALDDVVANVLLEFRTKSEVTRSSSADLCDTFSTAPPKDRHAHITPPPPDYKAPTTISRPPILLQVLIWLENFGGPLIILLVVATLLISGSWWVISTINHKVASNQSAESHPVLAEAHAEPGDDTTILSSEPADRSVGGSTSSTQTESEISTTPSDNTSSPTKKVSLWERFLAIVHPPKPEPDPPNPPVVIDLNLERMSAAEGVVFNIADQQLRIPGAVDILGGFKPREQWNTPSYPSYHCPLSNRLMVSITPVFKASVAASPSSSWSSGGNFHVNMNGNCNYVVAITDQDKTRIAAFVIINNGTLAKGPYIDWYGTGGTARFSNNQRQWGGNSVTLKDRHSRSSIQVNFRFDGLGTADGSFHNEWGGRQTFYYVELQSPDGTLRFTIQPL